MSTIVELRTKAEQGDYTSMYCMGFLYHYGACAGVSQTTEPDFDEAKKWYRKANLANEASEGEKYPHGYWHLAFLIKSQEGADNPEAVAAFKKACELGEPFAMIEIGMLYYRGKAEGLCRDEAKSLIERGITLIEDGECKIADLDYLHPQHGLQLCYMFLEEGEYTEARKYLERALATLHKDEAFAKDEMIRDAFNKAEEILVSHES